MTSTQRLLLQWATAKLNERADAEFFDPFAAPYVCCHCKREFTGKVFEQQDTGAAICPGCWRAGRR